MSPTLVSALLCPPALDAINVRVNTRSVSVHGSVARDPRYARRQAGRQAGQAGQASAGDHSIKRGTARQNENSR